MIKSIRIQNFKSLRDVTVDLEPVTVLIGRSGAGKSNFVQAIRFLRDYLGHRHESSAVNAIGGWPFALCATRDNAAKLSIEVRYDAPGIKGDFSYGISFQIPVGQNAASFSAESLALNDRTLFAQQQGKWQSPPDVVDPPNPGQSVLGLLYGIPETRISNIVLAKGIGCFDFPGEVLTNGSFNPADGTSLKDDASNFLTALDGIATNLSEFDRMNEMIAGLKNLNNSITSVELSADRSHIRVGHRVGPGKVLSFSLAQESEGFRRFLAHLIALYQQPPKQVLTFEEPEKGIYPGALSILADYFQAVADSGRSQIILTTHSPQLLKHFKPQQIRIVSMRGYETEIGMLAPEQKEALEEHLMTPDELLTVDDARIDTPAAP